MKEIYDRYATGFRGGSLRFDEAALRRWAYPYRRLLAGWLPSRTDARIVDVGCGDGRFLLFLRDRGYGWLAGVDISGEQVHLARQAFGDAVAEGDAVAYLAGRRGGFDLVVALDLAEHLSKERFLRFLAAAHVALRKGGRLILQTPNGESPFSSPVLFGDLTHQFAVTPLLLTSLLRGAGFIDIECREAGPTVRGPLTFFRFILWRVLRLSLLFWNLVEAGGVGSRICTRVFLASAVKESRPVGERM